ncbi:MAG: aspartate-semialdehyde dehydrogenase [Bacteroidetes bacterium]|nr:aspartate-semialdehyde dehydrogenase [Bacteroidota bacterium]
MKIAVVGATGLVGRKIIELLIERNFPITKLLCVASERSVGKKIKFKDQEVEVVGLEAVIAKNPDIALFSAGGETSLKFAERFAENGTYVVDNSSAWRMDKGKKLVVPEINASDLTKEDLIIANPNCSTIQLVLALSALHKTYNIKRLVISTYQSVTGSGIAAINQLNDEENGADVRKKYAHQIYRNCLPHCDDFTENGYTKEEMKLVNETKKILNAPEIEITATAVRVPVVGGHSESVNVEFENDFELDNVVELLAATPGVTVQDDLNNNLYPMPITAGGKDDIFVGRIRRDFSRPNCLNLWIVSDNLRKGAATNAVQIAEYVSQHFINN